MRGFELPVFLRFLGSLVVPSMDAASDWAVTLCWYDSGGYGWFRSGLIIRLLSGTISGAMLTRLIWYTLRGTQQAVVLQVLDLVRGPCKKEPKDARSGGGREGPLCALFVGVGQE